MKVKRQEYYEQNKTTEAFWLREFGYDLEKNADHLDYLKQYLEQKFKINEFKSIDEKLADIRNRVGFDLARKISDEIEKVGAHDESHCGCEPIKQTCGCPVKNASVQHSKENVAQMKNVLKYIKDVSNHEPHLSSIIILERCKKEDGLKFNDLPVDIEKLKKYIDTLLEKHDHKEEDVKYQPKNNSEPESAEDQVAEYYRHAEPSPS